MILDPIVYVQQLRTSGARSKDKTLNTREVEVQQEILCPSIRTGRT